MRVLIVHNILWTHYKSVLFQSLYEHSKGKFDLKVIQIAKNEVSRKTMEIGDYSYNYPYQLLFNDYLENLSSIKKIFALFKAIYLYKPDIVNLTGYAADISITLSVFFCKLLGIKVIISSESSENDNKPNPIKKAIKKLIVNAADYFICFGKTSADYLAELGINTSQIIENKAAIVDDPKIREIDATHPKIQFDKPYNFVFVGRLIDQKNLLVLLEAYKNIKNSNWGLVLLGDGTLENEIKDFAQNIENVSFYPAVSWQQVPEYLKATDVFILPSKSEAWGLVVNEAMICGMPVIVSNKCGCYKDLVKENGFVFDFQNAQELEIYMRYMIDNEQERLKMGKKSVEIIQDFSVDLVANRLIKAFEKI